MNGVHPSLYPTTPYEKDSRWDGYRTRQGQNTILNKITPEINELLVVNKSTRISASVSTFTVPL